MQELLQDEIDVVEFEHNELSAIKTFCDFETSVPPTEQAMVFQLMLQVRFQIWRRDRVTGKLEGKGPVRDTWMYMFERYLGTLTRKIHNRAYPESNLMGMHLIDMAVQHVSMAYLPELKPSYRLPSGRVLYASLLSDNPMLTANNSSSVVDVVHFPVLREKKPRVMKATLGILELASLRRLLFQDLNPSLYDIDPVVWIITSGVTVYGRVRTTCVKELRRYRGGTPGISTSGFMIYAGSTVKAGRVESFVMVELRGKGNGMNIRRKVALVQSYVRHYDSNRRLYFVDFKQCERIFINAHSVGREVLIYRQLSTNPNPDYWYVFPAKTGNNHHRW